jgi:hypothetical protein
MSEPANEKEYLKRFDDAQKVSGWGAEVKTHFPCPFCAAPDWLMHRVTDFEYATMKAGAECKECGRTAKFLIARAGGSLQAECVQTGGPDQPEWLTPKIRRI